MARSESLSKTSLNAISKWTSGGMGVGCWGKREMKRNKKVKLLSRKQEPKRKRVEADEMFEKDPRCELEVNVYYVHNTRKHPSTSEQQSN